MTHDITALDSNGILWHTVRNDSGEVIPPNALMRITGVTDDGEYTVAKPNADGQTDCLINSDLDIAISGFGQGHCVTPAHVYYDTANTPAAGETWGAAASSWKLTKDKAGAKIIGGNTDERVSATHGYGRVNSTSVITVSSGSVSAPSYTFAGDTNTGFYSPGADQIAAAAGGSQVMLITTQGVGVPAGSVGSPGLFVIGDTNSGFYSPAADQLAASVGGAQVLLLTSQGALVPAGSATAPSLAIVGDANTGIYGAAADQLAAAVGGAQVFLLTSTGAMVGRGDGTATPIDTTIRGPDAAGTDIQGGDITVRAGLGTGTGGSGSYLIQSAPKGSTGTTANTPTTQMAFDAVGGYAVPITSASISSAQNNYVPLATGSWDLDVTGTRDFTGISNTGVREGQTYEVQQVGTGTLTIKNNSGSSSTGNKIFTPGGTDISLTQYQSVKFVYNASLDSGNGGWLAIPYATGSSGISDGATLSTGLTFPNTGLHILDTNASHDLIIAPGSNITADRTLTITTGDADRTLTLSGNLTVDGNTTITTVGAALVAASTVAAQRAALSGVSGYVSFVIDYTDINGVAATSTAVSLFTLPARAEVGFALIKPTVQWTGGGGFTTLNMSLGDSGSTARWGGPFSGTNPPSDTVLNALRCTTAAQCIPNYDGTLGVEVLFQSNVNLTNLTAGQVEISMSYAEIPASV